MALLPQLLNFTCLAAQVMLPLPLLSGMILTILCTLNVTSPALLLHPLMTGIQFGEEVFCKLVQKDALSASLFHLLTSGAQLAVEVIYYLAENYET